MIIITAIDEETKDQTTQLKKELGPRPRPWFFCVCVWLLFYFLGGFFVAFEPLP